MRLSQIARWSPISYFIYDRYDYKSGVSKSNFAVSNLKKNLSYTMSHLSVHVVNCLLCKNRKSIPKIFNC